MNRKTIMLARDKGEKKDISLCPSPYALRAIRLIQR